MSEPGAGLPARPTPQGDYVPAVVHDRLAVSAGMTPRVDGTLVTTGLVGVDVTVAEARDAAGIAAANAVSAIAGAAGGVERIERCMRMSVYVACSPDFTEQSAVADGASAALTRLLGECGRAARSAIGVAALPSGAPVEVELTVALR